MWIYKYSTVFSAIQIPSVALQCSQWKEIKQKPNSNEKYNLCNKKSGYLSYLRNHNAHKTDKCERPKCATLVKK